MTVDCLKYTNLSFCTSGPPVGHTRSLCGRGNKSYGLGPEVASICFMEGVVLFILCSNVQLF